MGHGEGKMKELMLGNKAFARGLYEAGCAVVSSYPGTPSTEVTEEAAKYDDIYCEWAPNEKVAMEVAFGAALAGKRSDDRHVAVQGFDDGNAESFGKRWINEQG